MTFPMLSIGEPFPDGGDEPEPDDTENPMSFGRACCPRNVDATPPIWKGSATTSPPMPISPRPHPQPDQDPDTFARFVAAWEGPAASNGREPRVGVAVMVGDELNEFNWRRLMDSVGPHIDALYVQYNGEREGHTVRVPKNDIDYYSSQEPWHGHFGKQRNALFDMWQIDHGIDWLIWLDADDELLHGDRLKPMLAGLDQATQCVYLPYHYAWNRETGQVESIIWRERVVRMDVPWRWRHRIHEVLSYPVGTQFARRSEVIVKHWRELYYFDEKSRSRNRKLLAIARREEPNEPWYKFYQANEIYAEAMAQKSSGRDATPLFLAAGKVYEDYLKSDNDSDNSYIANHRAAECRRGLHDHPKAINQDLHGIKIRPTWPESYLGIVESFMALGQYDRALQWANACIVNAVSREESASTVTEPLNYAYTPFYLRGKCNRLVGNLDAALTDFQVAYSVHASDEVSQEITRLQELAREAHKPTFDLRKNRFGWRGQDKTIAFVTRPLYEPWNPHTITTEGSSGTEKSIWRVAQGFARQGYRVAIFGTPGEWQGTLDEDGIEWYDVKDWRSAEPWGTVVAVRNPEVFDANLRTNLKVLWMHDVNVGFAVGPWGERLAKADAIVTPSRWHAKHLHRLYGITSEIIPNGYDADIWVPRHDDPHVFMWTSSPDRGLDILLSYWQDIRDMYDDAELNIFYGFAGIDKIMQKRDDQALAQLKERVLGQVLKLGGEKGGIYWHDRQPNSYVAEIAQVSGMWAYPTTFLETFCISAIEMQSVGVTPVASRLAGLTETVAEKALLVPGNAHTEAYKKAFLRSIRYATDERNRPMLQAAGREHALSFRWENVWDKWSLMVQERTRELSYV